MSTDNTSYAFRIMKTGQPEHLYYGRRIRVESQEDFTPLIEKRGFAPGNTSIYSGCDDEKDAALTLENVRLEISSYGKGDIGQPFIELIHEDGSCTSDFVFAYAKVLASKPEYESLPSSYYAKNEKPEVLLVVFKDRNYNIELEIFYSVFEKSNVITRMTRLINHGVSKETVDNLDRLEISDTSGTLGKGLVRLSRIMSTQLDFEGTGYVFHTFNGAWAREMHHHKTKVSAGCMTNASFTGTSSNRANPFVMISDENTTEDNGEVYGINLVYSGNHYEALEVNGYQKTRFVAGINPAAFEYILEKGQVFEAPEAVMTYSNQGFNGMSQNMHRFVRNNIVRGKYQFKERPVLLNSWEACYFDINESRLLGLAKKAKEAGCELFVMDDGWFAERNDDSHSLGDWTVNEKKLPGGLKSIANKVNELGLDFGIWVEPEMINVNSELYKAHPEWSVDIPASSTGKQSQSGSSSSSLPHSEGRNQRLLDLANPEVTEYMTNQMRKIFSSANISYVKWDMNRIFSDVYSKYLPAGKQGQVFHEYVKGFYRMAKTLTSEFPDILFEGCASGGNRFDLGMLCYFPQIWASDDTDALERVKIQTGYSYGYPQSVYACHVSGIPNHQTLRRTPLETRFNVAAFGVLGYECNFKDINRQEFVDIAEQIKYYKKHRKVLQFGQLYRGRIIEEDNIAEWNVVSKDGHQAFAFMMQDRVVPNLPTQKLYIRGLNPDIKYTMSQRKLKYSIKDFGDLVNTVAPVHVKQDSLIHNTIDKFYKLDGEDDSFTAYGDVIMNAGIYLTQTFTGTGLNENVRHFQDCSSRIYYLHG